MRERIAIVGNGPIANETAAIIDSHDFIIRFNDCRSFGPGATRTDVVAVCNTGRAAKKMLESEEWRSHPGVLEASEIWSVHDPTLNSMTSAMIIRTSSQPSARKRESDIPLLINAYTKLSTKRSLIIVQLLMLYQAAA